jgi:type IV pilus assembly protein PilW
MVAILLGTILIGGAVTLYLVSKRSFLEVEQVAEASENARFSMQILGRALRHLRFFGPVGQIEGVLDVNPVSGFSIVNDCSGPAAALDTTALVFGSDLDDSTTSFQGCITDARPGTDVLVVKHLLPMPRYDTDPEDPNAIPDGAYSFPRAFTEDDREFYIAANSERAVMFFAANAADRPDISAGETYATAVAYPYAFNIFYVRDAGPTAPPRLSRKQLEWNGSAMAVVTQDLVEGVENLQFLFGEDNTGFNTDGSQTGVPDGVPDVFVNSANVSDWAQVVSVRAFALVRSAEDTDYVDDRDYILGDETWAPDCSILEAGGFNQCQFRRFLVQTEFNLRNPQLFIRSPN